MKIHLPDFYHWEYFLYCSPALLVQKSQYYPNSHQKYNGHYLKKESQGLHSLKIYPINSTRFLNSACNVRDSFSL